MKILDLKVEISLVLTDSLKSEHEFDLLKSVYRDKLNPMKTMPPLFPLSESATVGLINW